MANPSYYEKLKDPRWQKKRLCILERDGWSCQLCSDTKTTLEIHHLFYVGFNPWETPDDGLITYCSHCHKLVTAFGNGENPIIRIKKIFWSDGTVMMHTLQLMSDKKEPCVFIYKIEKAEVGLVTLILAEDVDAFTELFKYHNGQDKNS